MGSGAKMKLEGSDSIQVLDKSGTPIRVPVSLRMHDCRFTLAKAGEPEREATGTCYELQSTSSDYAWAWSFWSLVLQARHIRLISNGPGANYLTWQVVGLVYFAEVSESVERRASLSAHMNGRYPSVLPVEPLLGTRSFGWVYGDYACGIYVLSLWKEADGGMRAEVYGAREEKVFTLVTDEQAESGWRVDSSVKREDYPNQALVEKLPRKSATTETGGDTGPGEVEVAR